MKSPTTFQMEGKFTYLPDGETLQPINLFDAIFRLTKAADDKFGQHCLSGQDTGGNDSSKGDNKDVDSDDENIAEVSDGDTNSFVYSAVPPPPHDDHGPHTRAVDKGYRGGKVDVVAGSRAAGGPPAEISSPLTPRAQRSLLARQRLLPGQDFQNQGKKSMTLLPATGPPPPLPLPPAAGSGSAHPLRHRSTGSSWA